MIAVAALLLFIMISAGLSSCGAMFSGLTNGVLGTSYTSEDSDLVATEQAMLQWKTSCKVRLTLSKVLAVAMMNTAMTLTLSGITPTN